MHQPSSRKRRRVIPRAPQGVRVQWEYVPYVDLSPRRRQGWEALWRWLLFGIEPQTRQPQAVKPRAARCDDLESTTPGTVTSSAATKQGGHDDTTRHHD
jgi:hypothetical protein